MDLSLKWQLKMVVDIFYSISVINKKLIYEILNIIGQWNFCCTLVSEHSVILIK